MSTDTNSSASKMDTSEVRKVSFWVSQICVIIATILGVYLAASQGLKQAMTFEEIRSDKANYYLRQSLRSEMSKNAIAVHAYVDRLRKNDSFSVRKAALPLRTFVWENMKFSSNTLETPAEFLDANLEFMTVINASYNSLANTGENTDAGLKRMEDALNTLEKEVLPKLDTNLNDLKTVLEKRNIAL